MKRKIIVAVAVTFVATSLLWLGGIVGLYFVFYGGAPPFRIALQYPREVTLGDEFDLEIEVENARRKRVSLASIDVFDSFLEGFELIGTVPSYEDHEHVFNFRTLWFQEDLMPEGTVIVRVTLRAAQLGRYGGQLDVCTASELCTTVYAAIDVVEAS